MIESSNEIFADLIARHPILSCCLESIMQAEIALTDCFSSGGKLIVCGNGGSAADSDHIVGELMKSFRLKRPIDAKFAEAYRKCNGIEVPGWLEGALPAISLISHTAFLTAFSNDESAFGAFAQQVYGYGHNGDVLLGISTSGNSANVVEAAKVARAKEMKVIALTGQSESKLSRLADIAICVPETETYKIQELHLPVYHALCAAVEAVCFGNSQNEALA